MRQFYISDPAIFDLEMSAFDFKLYSYLHKNFTYFDMPRYKHFLQNIKFKKDFSNKGFSKVKQNIYTYQNGQYDS